MLSRSLDAPGLRLSSSRSLLAGGPLAAASSPTPEVPDGDELDASLSSSRLFDAACAAEG